MPIPYSRHACAQILLILVLTLRCELISRRKGKVMQLTPLMTTMTRSLSGQALATALSFAVSCRQYPRYHVLHIFSQLNLWLNSRNSHSTATALVANTTSTTDSLTPSPRPSQPPATQQQPHDHEQQQQQQQQQQHLGLQQQWQLATATTKTMATATEATLNPYT